MKKILSVVLVITLLSAFIITAQAESVSEYGTSYSKMFARAEEIVNYEWTPTQRIYTWNENPYNGKMYFEEGETVKGIPYTLFSWELGFDGLLSLEQYKEKASSNYSTQAYCTSVAADRVGPAYGTCCATFVSEIFGGNFMNGSNPQYDGVGGIENSSYSTCYKKVKAVNIQPGDALSCTSGGHIVWVAEANEEYIKFYEATPPITKTTTLYLNESTDSDGYLVYGGNTYNIVSKSNEIIRDDLAVGFNIDSSVPQPLKAYTLSTEKTIVYDTVNGNAKVNKIYSSDLCFIDAVFDNGWCHVNFPLDNGGLESGYVMTSVFFDDGYSVQKLTTPTAITTCSRNDLTESCGITGSREEVIIVGETTDTYQIIYPLSSGGYSLGWVDKDAMTQEVVNHPLNSMCPFKSYPCTSDHFYCYNSDLTTSPGRIYTTDFCTIEEIYADGWCRVNCPWSDGSSKIVYTKIENFVKNPNTQLTEYNADDYIYLFSNSDLSNQIYRIYPGDVCYAVGESGNATQIFMPMTGKDYFVLGWCLTEDLKQSGIFVSEPSLTSENKAVHAGEEFTVDVNIENNPGFCYLKLRLNYDSDLFDFIEAINGTVSADSFSSTTEALLWDSDKNATADGTLVTLKFKAKDNLTAGEYTLGIAFVEGYNYDEENITFEVNNAAITVVDFIYGDVTGDNVINGKDLVRLRKYLLTLDETTGTADVEIALGADTTGDGVVNGKDLVRLRKYLLNYDEATGTSPIVLGPIS